jgi:hypothetical protein
LGGLLLAFTAEYNTKVFVFGYQLVDMLCIMVPVKFDGGLFISVLRYKGQKFTFSKRSNFQKQFKPRRLKKGRAKSHFS